MTRRAKSPGAQSTPIQKQGQSLDSVTVGGYQSPQAQTLVNAAQSGTPFCEVCEEARKNSKIPPVRRSRRHEHSHSSRASTVIRRP